MRYDILVFENGKLPRENWIFTNALVVLESDPKEADVLITKIYKFIDSEINSTTLSGKFLIEKDLGPYATYEEAKLAFELL